MTWQGSPEGTPPKDEVAEDFTVRHDADLRPVTNRGDEEPADGSES